MPTPARRSAQSARSFSTRSA